jgi:DNA-binding NarL/FixJ family response regulator
VVRQAPDLLVTDLNLKDGSAIGLIRLLQLRQPAGRARAQVVVLAEQESDPLLLDALQAGADNFFLIRGADPQALAVRVRETLAGGANIAPWIARRLLDHFGVGVGAGQHDGHVEDMNNPLALTMAERNLLRQLSVGTRLADVALHQGVLPNDLTARVRDIYRKMQWALHAGNLSLT